MSSNAVAGHCVTQGARQPNDGCIAGVMGRPGLKSNNNRNDCWLTAADGDPYSAAVNKMMPGPVLGILYKQFSAA